MMETIPVRQLNAKSMEPEFSGSFSVRDLSVLLNSKDMVQELHRHDFFYLLVLKKASGVHVVDFVKYPIMGQEVFFMRPGQVHELVLNAGGTGYLMQFSTGFYFPKNKAAHQILRKASACNRYSLDVGQYDKLESVLNYIIREYHEKRPHYEEVIKANMGIFFIELGRQRHDNSPAKASHHTQERLDKFMELLEAHIFTHKQVSQYAEMLNLSVYQLNAITKAALEKTCSELINEQLILEAKRCLLATSNQVNQTAYRLGYEDVSYFIRFFKKQTGYSPEAFRINFR